ncbi:histone-lysine N-methyltransferase [Tasmannia lanceolata]|uniref:histone-lysine N-methyltransferase n=1 Tax=Tasmannia lanceolata TaxID=3420 RepID=UPI0040630B73
MMRGVGGPLLCIGDLLGDVGDGQETPSSSSSSPSSPSSSSSTNTFLNPLSPSHLHNLFQENYDQLNKALEGTDHSWTVLTLKLCSALETADKLVQSTNSNAAALTEKIGVLESIIKRGDSAVDMAKAIHSTRNKK